MVPFTFSQTHHPFSTRLCSPRAFCSVLLALIFSSAVIQAQEITGLEVVKTLEHQNYSVAALDCYFENGQQLVAYSNNSGNSTGDTLVIYDFAQDLVLSEVPGTGWPYDIRFIDAEQLLFRNNSTLFRLVNFTTPVVTELLQNVITFTVSPDKETVATLRYEGNEYQVEVAAYNSTTGTLSIPDIYAIPIVPDNEATKLNFSSDGNYIALNGGYENNYVYVINMGTQSIMPVNTPANGGTYSPVFYVQAGNLRLAVGGGFLNGGIEVIDVDALIVESSIPVFPHYNYALAFDQTQRYLACGGYDGIIKLFGVENTDFTEVNMYQTGWVTQLLITQDNEYVISGHGGSGLAWVVIHHIVREPSGISPLNEDRLLLYPNPTNGILQLDGLQEAVISIYDIHGKYILRRHTNGSTIDVQGLADGLYLLKTENEKEVRARIFMKD
ncbi:MAG TPA: T9SS type A sorting domain-containing protein [Saprospiraceae bacterium]|nr:T9SS type A sorting domain-containing protein [Saprospiraceae bacterium]